MPRITGTLGVANKLAAMSHLMVVEKVSQALFVAGEMIRAEASFLITQGSVSGRNHVPSLPGEPPMNDSGVLRINIETTQPAPLRVEVSSNARYAVALEFGTSRMAPRPYMAPATEIKRKEVVDLVGKAVKAAIRSAGPTAAGE